MKQGTPPVFLSKAFRGTAALCLGLLFWLGGTSPTRAAEPDSTNFPERLKLWGGYQHLFGLDARYRFDGPQAGIGTTFDFEKDLGGETSDHMARAGAHFRLTPNHAIGFSWYAINLRGDRTLLDVDLTIDDVIFSAQGHITSQIGLTIYRLFYDWSFYRSQQVELVLSPGIYLGDFNAEFLGSATIRVGDIPPVSEAATVTETLFVPLPTIGIGLEYRISPRLKIQTRTDFFYVNVKQVEGSLAEFTVGLEYRLFKHFAVGATFNRLWLDLDWKPGSPDGWAVQSSWNNGLFYGALYF